MAGTNDSTFAIGDFVSLVDMPDVAMNGAVGELVRPVGKDRWVVALEDKSEKSKVVNKRCLVKLEKKTQPKGGPMLQPGACSIVGTWDDWELHEMRWNGELQCFEYPVILGNDGKESFKILVDGDWDKVLHPDSHDANTNDGHTLVGPDTGGQDEEWTIGRYAGKAGENYIVRLALNSDGTYKEVTWALGRDGRDGRGAPPAEVPVGNAARPASPVPVVRQGEFPAIRPQVPAWGPAPEKPDLETLKRQAEQVMRSEREARDRLAARLEEAAKAEMLMIEDGQDRGRTVGQRLGAWESMLRTRKLKDAKFRYDERYAIAQEEKEKEEKLAGLSAEDISSLVFIGAAIAFALWRQCCRSEEHHGYHMMTTPTPWATPRRFGNQASGAAGRPKK
uniref:AMP-activated protein kinase glycogen-binding domain-containing protein n=1 Tax=Alexandrium monilatum TaxID=311494 RepID=A0A7S4R4S4_9DINO